MIPILYITLTQNRFIQDDFLTVAGHTIYPNRVDEDADNEYHDICSKQIEDTIKSFMKKIVMVSIFSGGAAVWPVYRGISEWIKVETIGLKIPLTDENSNIEFLVNLFVVCNIMGHGFFGYIACEIGLCYNHTENFGIQFTKIPKQNQEEKEAHR